MSRWLQSGRRRNKTRRNKLTETWHLLKGRGARSGPAARALGCVATQGGAGGWRGPRGCRAGGGAAAKPAGLRARGRSYLRGRGRTDSAGFSAGEGCPQGRGRESAWSSGEKGPCEAAGVTGQLARACARAPVCACAVRACVRACERACERQARPIFRGRGPPPLARVPPLRPGCETAKTRRAGVWKRGLTCSRDKPA